MSVKGIFKIQETGNTAMKLINPPTGETFHYLTLSPIFIGPKEKNNKQERKWSLAGDVRTTLP